MYLYYTIRAVVCQEKKQKNIESFIPLCFSEYIYERTTKMQMFYLDSNITEIVCQEKKNKKI